MLRLIGLLLNEHSGLLVTSPEDTQPHQTHGPLLVAWRDHNGVSTRTLAAAVVRRRAR